jgi:hypothetical protein
MSNDMTPRKTNNLPAAYGEEADALLDATEGHDKLLKYAKGKYKVRDDEVPLGTQYVAHANQLTYCWTKFVDKKRVDRHHGKAIEKWRPPRREDLDDKDPATWEKGTDGKPKDPWVFQLLLPFEHPENGDVVIFTTASVGGRIATEELVREYARRLKRKGSRALPIVRLASKDMPTRGYGDVPRPHFEIDGWEDVPDAPLAVNGNPPAADPDDAPQQQRAAGDLDDEIPF